MKQVFLLMFLVFAVFADAQSPRLINYQGTLRNAAGLPLVNQNIRIRFELRQGTPSSASVFQEDQALSTNLLGLFSARIGEKNPTSFAAINWQSGDMFLAVAIDTTGGDNFTTLGTQQLVSVPYALHAASASSVASTFSNNVLTIGGQSYTLSPPAEYGAGTGISVTGSVIANTAPDQTVTIQSSGSNIQVSGTYPAFTLNPAAALTHSNGNLSISDGNTVNITPTVAVSNNVLSVGPVSNSVVLPSAPSVSLTGNGAASVTAGGGFNFTVHVPAVNIALTNSAGALGSATSAVNDININIPPTQYNPATGALNSGTVSTNITPSLSFSGGVLTAGPMSNSVNLPASSAASLAVTGAATVNPTGPAFSLHVIPANVAVSNTAGAAAVNSQGTNSFNINIPAPQYNQSTGILQSGTVTTDITQSLSVSGNMLTVGRPSNTVLLPAAPATSLTGTGIAQVSPVSGNNFTVNVPPPAFVSTGPAQMLGAFPDFTLASPATPTLASAGIVTVGAHPNYVIGVPEPTFTPNGIASISGVFPNYTINTASIPAPSVTGEGLAIVTPSSGTNFTVNVPPYTYVPSSGILSSGSNSVDITSPLVFSGKVLSAGPASNSVDISAVSPWEENSGNVILSVPASNVGIGTGVPAHKLQIESGVATQLSIVSGNTTSGSILFGNSSNHLLSRIGYDNANNLLRFSVVGASNGLTIGDYSNVGINGLPVAGARLLVRADYGKFEVNNYGPGSGPIANTILLSTLTGSANNAPQLRFKTELSPKWMDIGLSATGDFVLEGSDIARVVVTDAGQVGIGTSTPTATFHVNGSTRFADGSEGAGKVLTSDASGNATWQAFGGMTPGMVMAFAGTIVPTGWAICDGTAISRTTYAALFAVAGTAWGSGDGSTTFNLPDMRGMFLRGVDGTSSPANDPNRGTRTANNAGGNTGNNVGSEQNDLFQSHSHGIPPLGNTVQTSLLGGSAYAPGGTGVTTSVGGSETRPKNVYVYYIIKL